MRPYHRFASALVVAGSCSGGALSAQAASTDAPNAYKGLTPGQSTRQDAHKALGAPAEGMHRGECD